MTLRGLLSETVGIPLAAGLATKADARALTPPGLTICQNAQFDELGGIQLRRPYASEGLAIAGGGTITDPRRVVAYGDELLLFTKESLYSRAAGSDTWVARGTHLAAKIDETPRFVTTDDQILCDRAELAGVVFVSWHKVVGGNTTGYIAAYDATTGAVIMAAQELVGFQRIRLTALATKVLLSFFDGINGVYCYALDPASPATALAGASTTVQTGTGATVNFDVVRVPGADQAVYAIRRAVTTSYDVVTMTAGLVAARANKARTCDGPIAVSCPSAGTHVQVVRASGTNVVGDYIALSGLSDVYTAQAIGTVTGGALQIAAAHRSDNRCYVFWSCEDTLSTQWASRSNYVTTTNTLGTEADFVFYLGVASRAFEHDGRVYFWGAFAGATALPSTGVFRAALQNTYFLYRDDGFLVAKALPDRAGGFSAATGFLPGVHAITATSYACAGVERRIIELGGKASGYGARSPREIVVTFDADEARRTVRLGSTLYVTGGEILQYDGVQLTEVGFHIWPWDLSLSTAAGTSHEDGDYGYKAGYRWDNGQGESERSGSVLTGLATVTGGPKDVGVASIPALHLTHKLAQPVSVEVWRTPVNPTEDSPFYLVTSRDPGDTGLSANEYIANDTTIGDVATLGDQITDTSLISREQHPENFGELEQLAPPAATIIAASADRLFLAGVAGDPHRVWYSRLREEGEVASFNDGLTVAVPPAGGPITGLAFLNETLVVFKSTAIYALPGDGFDNVGGGTNFGPARLLSSDVGAVNHESIAMTPQGLVFKSRKGWYLLGKGWDVQYVGAPVADFDDDEVQAVHVLEAQHQVRCLTDARLLVWDYLAGQWSEWTIAGGVGACIWDGTYTYATASGVFTERTDYTGVDYALDLETAWIPLGQMQGFGRVWKVLVLGEYRTANRVRVRLSRNYAQSAFQDKTSAAFSGTAGDLQQFEVRPSIQECQALKIRITGRHPTLSTAPTGEAFKLTALALELGIERGLNRIPATRRQ